MVEDNTNVYLGGFIGGGFMDEVIAAARPEDFGTFDLTASFSAEIRRLRSALETIVDEPNASSSRLRDLAQAALDAEPFSESRS